MPKKFSQQDLLYRRAAEEFTPAVERLARAYEPDADQRRDLVQEIHFALWRSFALFAGDCSVRTWIYRVAHNVAISQRSRRRNLAYVSLETIADAAVDADTDCMAENSDIVARLHGLIRQLGATDAEVILLYLEDIDAASIGEITGLSSGAVATRVHRIKSVLAKRFREAGTHE